YRQQCRDPPGLRAPVAPPWHIAHAGRGRHNAAAPGRCIPFPVRAGIACRPRRASTLMNQTRVFLIFAWLMVAVLLWMEWGRDKAAPATAPVAAQTQGPVPAAGAVPGATVPHAPGSAPAPATAQA